MIEVLVAMVIIMVIFAIAMRIFGNVMNSGVSFRKLQVQQQLDLLAKETQQVGYITDWDAKIDSVDYHFKTDTTSVPGYAKLFIQAQQQGRLLGEVKCYFKEKETPFED